MEDAKRVCAFEGCTNVGEWTKQIGDRLYRRRLCSSHRKRLEFAKKHSWDYEKFVKKVCSVCSWKGPCDIHRVKKQIGYRNGNMISICPNCHRLVHLGELKL